MSTRKIPVESSEPAHVVTDGRKPSEMRDMPPRGGKLLLKLNFFEKRIFQIRK